MPVYGLAGGRASGRRRRLDGVVYYATFIKVLCVYVPNVCDMITRTRYGVEI